MNTNYIASVKDRMVNATLLQSIVQALCTYTIMGHTYFPLDTCHHQIVPYEDCCRILKVDTKIFPFKIF